MSQYLYLLLNIGSLSIPLLYSIFEKKFHFIQYIKAVCLSISIIAVPFLIWDAAFTKIGVWGFNSNYHLPLKIIGMPIEEWLFFICIPYACLFTHEVLKYYFPNLKLSRRFAKQITVFLLLIAIGGLVFNFGKQYTTINFILFLLLMGYSLAKHLEVLQTYLPSFFVILFPFFIVNGVLTGSFIEAPVVWYDDAENMNFRLFTIPFEDAFYAFNLLFSIQLVFNYLKNKIYES
ncbi:lycopene cyclase domain-containing protein [Tenacibaculum maritimum]|uniref:lycopene cyclase domain-containing protein n=1 Tax=Tenacibaculum maritimum TaxID=107401 RepID=UPI0012E66370|nr:lycopene cyclase domain-containing protein [Tenacibaculum maritimum]CAA0156990.1 Lycopene cyclase [Tenacibaculum maritimum]